LVQYTEDYRTRIGCIVSIEEKVCSITYDTYREELEVVSPNEWKDVYLLGATSILLLQTIGAEEDEYYYPIMSEERE